MPRSIALVLVFVLVLVLVLVAGCGGSGQHASSTVGIAGAPTILTVNGATEPTAPRGFLMEVAGFNFLAAPGAVTFRQGPTSVTVTPAASAWSDTTIAVLVPGSLTAPGSVTVTVTTAGGTSNPVAVTVVATPKFSPSSLAWVDAAAPLPAGRKRHRAVGVRGRDAASGWVYVLGGNDAGAPALASCLSATVTAASNDIAGWVTATAMPAARTLHAAAVADSTNALVPTTTAYIYVLGGGPASIFIGTVDRATGAILRWDTSATALPEALTGARAVVANGFLYVTGGARSNGSLSSACLSAPIGAGGDLGAFTTSPSALPQAVAFHDLVAFGGFLYVLMGDPAGGAGGGTTERCFFASIRTGAIGAWTETAAGKPRAHHSALLGFGQIVAVEGVLGKAAVEGEAADVKTDGSGALDAWADLVSASAPALNVFDGAGVVSPVLTASGNPRFFLIGGEALAAGPGPTSATRRTNSPP